MQQKRCYRQEFRLRPDRAVVQIVEYALAYCAERYDIDLHDFIVISNHDHLEHTDTRRNRPAFYGLFHSLVARATNAHFGEWESLWSAQRYSAPVLQEPQDAFDKSVYIHLNAVAAGLVRYAWDWLGVSSYSMEYDRPRTVERPEGFFSDKMPKTVELVIRRPKGLRPELTDRELRREIRATVKERQGAIVKERLANGKRILGMDRVLKQPRTGAPHDKGRRRGIRPAVAAKSKWVRIEALQRNKQFVADHRQARLRFEAGGLDVTFPAGTYLMRLRFNVACHAP